MVDEKPLTAREIGQKLVDILDGLLKAGNWEASLFLKASAGRLRELREEASNLAQDETVNNTQIGTALFSKSAPTGYIQVFISVFQLEGTDLQVWHRTIRALTEYNVTRPVYRDVKFVQEFIRSKADFDHHGYVIVNIKESDIYELAQPSKDALGHELILLKEGSVKLENIIGFVHGNKKRYLVKENGLVFIDEMI